ncbi:MAG: hypothetical protein H5T50_06590 [Nitrososphaeria archaeon]|nr:hypothetical protein [Nitrososphaeria archaeon]
MQLEVIRDISFNTNLKEFIDLKKIRGVSENEVERILELGLSLAKSRALLAFARVEKIDGICVQVEGGHVFEGKILSDKLHVGQPIVVYVITLGEDLERKASELAKESIIKAYVLEGAGDYLLLKAREYVRGLVEKRLGGKVSSFAPGTGKGDLFDIRQQEVIFRMLEPWKHVGVSLTSSFLMVPRKSSSGIFAVTGEEYVACMYCPRKCESRRKPFVGTYTGVTCDNLSTSHK